MNIKQRLYGGVGADYLLVAAKAAPRQTKNPLNNLLSCSPKEPLWKQQ
jgi:hypothetical protein